MIEACGTRYMAEQRAYMQLNNARVISKKKKNKLRTLDETKKNENEMRQGSETLRSSIYHRSSFAKQGLTLMKSSTWLRQTKLQRICPAKRTNEGACCLETFSFLCVMANMVSQGFTSVICAMRQADGARPFPGLASHSCPHAGPWGARSRTDDAA